MIHMKWLLYCNILMMIPLFSGCDSSENNNDTGTYRIYKAVSYTHLTLPTKA